MAMFDGQPATITVKKTTIGRANNGLSGSNNNCYFTGATVCWTVSFNGEPMWNLKRKGDALAVASWLEKQERDLNFIDIECQAFYSSEYCPDSFKGTC